MAQHSDGTAARPFGAVAGPVLPSWTAEFVRAAAEAGDDVAAGIALAERYGRMLPAPGDGTTAARWALLARAGEQDLSAARILEAHSDALAILHESGAPVPGQTWGVFAAEGPGVRLEADESGAGDTARLSGTKPWCSLAESLDRALVTAHTGDARRLYAVDLKHDSVTVDPPGRWAARGLAHITSTSVHFAGTPATPVGQAGWYLARSGFAWGGMGVAACWYGGALGLAASLRRASAGRGGDLPALHVGVVDSVLHGAGATLAQAAVAVDAGAADGPDGALLALRVRAVVVDAVERTIRQVGHALGPAPLAFDERHARRVADLELYVRQHHGERDLAALGHSVLAEETE